MLQKNHFLKASNSNNVNMKKITKLDNNEVARVEHLTNSWLDEQDKNTSETSHTQLEKWLIGIACIGFFPLVYLIGRTFVNWFS